MHCLSSPILGFGNGLRIKSGIDTADEESLVLLWSNGTPRGEPASHVLNGNQRIEVLRLRRLNAVR